MNNNKFNIRRVLIVAFSIISFFVLLYFIGRPIWNPLFLKLNGNMTIQDRINQIELSKPPLSKMKIKSLAVLCFKREKRIDVYCDDLFYKSFHILAASGKLGPKLKEGDGQVPEGLYSFDAINPNSSYYLSLRISYPNKDDINRSISAGISDYGGEIYMHGKSASIGCLAIGDVAIDEVFYLANKVGLGNTKVVISPVDFRSLKDFHDSANGALYEKLSNELSKYKTGNQ